MPVATRPRARRTKLDDPPVFDINEETGSGLLSLPADITPSQYRSVFAEITAAGYEVVPHEDFWALLDGRFFYLLRLPMVPRSAASRD